ncbi:hypothetical protein [Chryseobacterium sp.]|uniref:hypothetical protein n=1 Tax=Chryseobacterium sp. TaxID=1871047 RepID=UPI00284ED237|nr:hypothetical protein [Chryseobacterium sp.]MDR3022849.1 hypothetical protein [Chryseobacterium sp.]
MMKKNLKLFASALGFILLFYACRTDEMVNSEQRTQNEKIGAFERFENQRSQEILNKKTHSSKSGVLLPLSYSQPFSEIIYQFLVNHPDFYDKLADDFGEIDYNVASQTFGEEKKYIFYPILKDGKVTSLWYGKLNEDRSWVDFYLVHDTSASTQKMIGEFQNYYSKKMASRGEPDPPVIEIPEIIITPPSINPPIHDPIPGTGGDGTYTPPYTGDMSGGPIMHGGGTGTSYSPNQDIINELKDYPCAQDLVKQLPNLKNDIAKAMNDIFNKNENYNIIFKPKSGLGNVDGTTFSSFSNEFGTFKATINLNDNILKNATKEFILVTMYHEVLHAYLDYEKFKLGVDVFQEKYPGVIIGYDYAVDGTIINRFTFIEGHQQLGGFLTTLQNILSSYNPALPLETVKALAKSGITTVTAQERELNKNERDISLGKQKGTKCP